MTKTKTELKINFANEEAAEHFMSWLCGCGEQEYWMWMEEREQEEEGDITALRFHYPYPRSKEENKGVFEIDTTVGRMSNDQ